MSLNPDFKTFAVLARKHGLVPVYRELPADLDTPVTVYLKLARAGESALLESVEGGEKLGRYSFISVSHHLRFESRGHEITIRDRKAPRKLRNADPIAELKNVFSALRPATLPELPRFCGGAVGMVGYDMARNFEALPDRLGDDLGIPDSVFLFTDECVVFDHWKHKLLLVKWNRVASASHAALKKLYANAQRSLDALAAKIARPAPAARLKSRAMKSAEFRSNLSVREYCDGVKRIQEYIRAGDIIQAVYSQRFEMTTGLDALQIYRALRMVNPSPYLYLLELGDFSLAGSSPEILVRKEGELAVTRPIAGTRKRGTDEKEDQALEQELRKDPKERAEHLMLVDLGRNDLGRCCVPGTVKVPGFMNVERYSHVMHLVSSVEGRLKKSEDAFSLFRACFPAGTVSGAPKIRAMEIIEETEKIRRKSYAGSVGYFSYSGNMDMAITIRTVLLKGGKIYVQAGAGIVADSVPESEEKETRSKAAAMFRAVQLAQKNFQ